MKIFSGSIVVQCCLALIFSSLSPAYAQSAWQQQQMQMQRQQQQQQQMQRQQEQQRQQQQAQQRQQEAMRQQQQQQQMRQQQMQAQQRQQQQTQTQQAQQRRANEQASQNRRDTFNNQRGTTVAPRGGATSNGTNAYRPPANAANSNRSAPTTAIRGTPNRNVSAAEGRGFVSSAGVSKLTRPLTPGEIKKGFTGKITGDGRALVKFQGRVFAVPAAGLSGLVRKPANQNLAASKFTIAQKQSIASRITSIRDRKSPKIFGLGQRPCTTFTCKFNKSASSQGFQNGIPLKRAAMALPKSKGSFTSTAESANFEHLIKTGYVQPYKVGTRTTVSNMQIPNNELVRVWKNGVTSSKGYWLLHKSEIENLNSTQIRDKFSLPYEPDMISDFSPSREDYNVRIGTVGPQNFDGVSLAGGGTQIELLDSPIDEDFINGRRL